MDKGKEKGKEKESEDREQLITRAIQHHSEALERIQEMNNMIKSREKELQEALSKYTDGIDIGVDVQKLDTLRMLVSDMIGDCFMELPGDESRTASLLPRRRRAEKNLRPMRMRQEQAERNPRGSKAWEA